DGEQRDFRYPWHVVAQHNADYRAYVEAELARMGPEHPLVRTQYLLEPIESAGRFFSETQLLQLQGGHGRLSAPDTEMRGHGDKGREEGLQPLTASPRLPVSVSPLYVAGIDIAGEDEEAEDAALR